MHTKVQDAITAALSCNWEKAIELNELILKEDQNDINALSRIGYAYTQMGEIEKAKKTYKRILTIDKYNFIAQKNLDKINAIPAKGKRPIRTATNQTISPSLFLEEPGKTKAVNLINPAPIGVLSGMRVGDEVYLNPKKHSIEVRDLDKVHIGALPDDITFRLLKFLSFGNTYQVFIKNIQKNSVSVFIKEKSRGKKFKFQPTFHLSSYDYNSSTPKDLKSIAPSEDEAAQEDAEE